LLRREKPLASTGLLGRTSRSLVFTPNELSRLLDSEKNAHNILAGKQEGKWIPRRRWEENIKIDFKETGYEGVKWARVAQDNQHECGGLVKHSVPRKRENLFAK
jgi:hypothetical protein